MRLSSTIAVVASLILIGSNTNHVEAYGALGHTLTGQIAQQFLTPKTQKAVNQILAAESGGLLSNVSSWADQIRLQYKWSAPLHFFNPVGDNPPEHCAAEYVYDGQDNVNAIYNYTATLKNFKTKPPKTPEAIKLREEALKFFPLHDSTRQRGGNDAPILWGKAKKNLHSLWDTLMIVKDVEERFGNDPLAYLDDTIKLAKTHWKDASTWTYCGKTVTNNPWSKTTKSLKTLCPAQWAKDANALDCLYVWNDYSETRDYSTDYFQKVTGSSSDFLVQRLLAIGGVRMAAILNEIYDPRAKPPLTMKGRARLPSEH
ncbi:hypothetical protein BGX34_009528 [Mortierella sp. NVP85]|nr:hypothetical protein BGX34_009528 [Mortierella sp. NVP85]